MLRILDVNINRAREALRVMEDAARFALDDAALCSELKHLRHDLRSTVDSLPIPKGALEANRDTAGDVGASISTDTEMHRHDLLEVVIAAGKRLTESLRVIEEMSKTLDDKANAANVEALRYRAYDLDARLQLRFGSGKAKQWKLCLLLTRSLCKQPWKDVLLAAIENGCDCVQVREKEMDGGELMAHVKKVIEVAQPQAAVIVNDRLDVALAANADGVHLGQADFSVRDARKIAGRNIIIGVSTHDLSEAKAAIESGADYCGVGAMFSSSLKTRITPSGPRYLQQFIDRFPQTPHLAIGGIAPDNIQQLASVGVKGVAVSSAICSADDPGEIVRMLLQCLSATCSSSSSAPAPRPACR